MLRQQGAGSPAGDPCFFLVRKYADVYIYRRIQSLLSSTEKTPYKWLDLSLLLKNILQPHHDILTIKYFTARLSSRSGNRYKPLRQDAYLRALQAHCKEVEIYFGYFQTNLIRAPLARPQQKLKVVEVIKTEEKGSDVNLAVHLLNDAWLDVYDSAVIVSNDGDVAEAMHLVKKQTDKQLGLVTPGIRHPSQKLLAHADFHRHIRKGSLKRSQLPSPIPGTNLIKPREW